MFFEQPVYIIYTLHMFKLDINGTQNPSFFINNLSKLIVMRDKKNTPINVG